MVHDIPIIYIIRLILARITHEEPSQKNTTANAISNLFILKFIWTNVGLQPPPPPSSCLNILVFFQTDIYYKCIYACTIILSCIWYIIIFDRPTQSGMVDTFLEHIVCTHPVGHIGKTAISGQNMYFNWAHIIAKEID